MCVDVRGCSQGIRALMREFSRSMSENRAKTWINICTRDSQFRKFRRDSPFFSGEERNARHGVESDPAPISQLARFGFYII